MIGFLLVVFPFFMQYWDDTDAVKAMKTHVTEITLAQNEGRAPGSEGEKAAAAYMWKAMSDKGVDMLTPEDGDVFGIKAASGDTLVSRNIVGFIQGYDAELKNHYIVIGARMDNLGVNRLNVDGVPVVQEYTGANGNASGMALLIELAGRMAQKAPLFKRSVIFIGFGASTSTFAGAWHFLHQTFKADADKIDAMINLDMLGVNRDGMMAFTCGNEDMGHIIDELASTLQPVKPVIIPYEPYPSDHQVFYASEIPSVLFTTGRYPEHNTHKDKTSILDFDFMERELEYLSSFAEKLVNAPKDMPSFHSIPKTQQSELPDNVIAWSDCDVPPLFLGNADPSNFLRRWVYTYLKYPEDCIRDGVQGRVMVEFIIAKNGEVQNVRAVRSPDEQLSEAAVKAVAASPKWRPARKNGQKVSCSMTIPVEFRLQKKK